MDPYNSYVQTFEGMTEEQRKATIYAEARQEFMKKIGPGTSSSMGRKQQLKLPGSLVG